MHGAHVGDEVLDPVGRHDRDGVADLGAELDQPGGDVEASSRASVQVSVRQASPSGTWCLSEYAGSSAWCGTVSASASTRVRPSTCSSIRARSAATSVIVLTPRGGAGGLASSVTTFTRGHKAVVQSPRLRPMISFWISVVPP